LKDTFRNILLNSEFVVHTPRTEHLDRVERTAESFGPEVSEVEEIGFHPTESEMVDVPGLEEPPVRLECRLHDQFPVAGGKVTVLYGEIVQFHLDEDVYENEYVQYDELDPLARLGPDAYTNLGDYLKPTQSADSEETATSDLATD